jgi:hypothetical protein
VKGGTLRTMHPSECGGRQHCIELQEGRDLSILDPDLIDLAKKTVVDGKRQELEKSLIAAIDANDLHAIAELMEQVRSQHLRVGFQVTMVAETLVRNFQLNKVALTLQEAIRTTPKAQLELPLRRAEAVFMDPQNPLLEKLLQLTQVSELAVAITRVQDFIAAQACSGLVLSAFEAPHFKKLYNYVGRYDLKRFTAADRRRLISVMLQYCGQAVLSDYMTGDSLPYLARLIKHTLNCCNHLHTETEPMQLARLCISLSSRSIGGDLGDTDVVIRGEKRQDFTVFTEEFRISGQLNPIYAIEKYSLLNLSGDSSAGGILSSFLRRPSLTAGVARGHSDAVALLSHGTSISKSLLRLQSANKEGKVSKDKNHRDEGPSQSEICRLFDALTVVMGDKPLSSIQSSKSALKTALVTGRHSGVIDVAMELIGAGIKQKSLVDELYIQLCKQLTRNPKVASVLQGWILFSLYLHYFAPSEHFLPFLQNFVESSLKKLTFNDFHVFDDISGADDGALEDDELGLDPAVIQDRRAVRFVTVNNLINYCLQLLTVIQMSYRTGNSSYHNSAATPLTSTSNPGNNYTPKLLERSDIEYALLRQVHYVEVLMLTGSKYVVPVRYGELTNPLSLLQLAYMKYSGLSMSQLFSLLKKKHSHLCAENDLSDVMLLRSFFVSTFRGFGVYFHVNVSPDDESKVEGDEPEPESEPEEDNQVSEIQLIPVQPEERQYIDWKYDLVWDTMDVAKQVAGNSGIEPRQHNEDGDDEDDGDGLPTACRTSIPSGCFIVRRRTAVATEKFASQFELFGDVVSSRDVNTLQVFWESWLSRPHSSLPLDYARVDLLFAEDCRYVNSGLYGSAEWRHYLLALQLALSWEDEACSDWGEGHSAVLSGCDLSVRPIFKFPIVTDLAESVEGSNAGDDHIASNTTSNRLSLSATQFRKSVFQHQHVRRSFGEGSSPRASMTGTARDTEPTNDDSDEDLNEEESDDQSNGEVSLYSSVDYDEHTEPSEDDQLPRQPIRSYESLDKDELNEIRDKLRSLGCDQWEDHAVTRHIVETVAKIHQLAIELSIPTSSPRFRYFIKRAYVEYVQSLPLFSSHFAMGRVAHASLAESVTSLEFQHSVPVSMPAVPLGADVLLVMNCNGILFLNPSEWTVVFHAPLFDIEGISSAPIVSSSSTDEDETTYDSGMMLALLLS